MNARIMIPACLLLVACGGDHEHETVDPHAGHDHAAAAEAGGASNRMAIPAVVRRNLGLTFATATYRAVTATLNLPGHFELLPSAQQHYPLPAAGRVRIVVEPLQEVAAGSLLVELDTPAWRELQNALGAAAVARLQAEAALAQASANQTAAGELTGGGAVYASALAAAQADVAAAREAFRRHLAQAATLTGMSADDLLADDGGQPRWQSLQVIPIRASAAGVVGEIAAASGNWVGAGEEVVHMVAPTHLRFRAKALQADLIDHLRDGQLARIVPPEGAGRQRRAEAVSGRIRIGVTGDPDTRTVDVYIDVSGASLPAWARPQVAALAAVVVNGDPDVEELAIPQRAVIQDGLDRVFFRRDPKDPDAVIRTIADLGPSDGRWVTVYSGLGEGDEVVIDGVYQLKLATTGQQIEAGHFHADGTWHDKEH